MKLSLLLCMLFSKKYKDKYMQKQWDKKSDDSIIIALADAEGWIELSKGRVSTPTINDIANDCQDRLDKFIMPQVTKRGLL